MKNLKLDCLSDIDCGTLDETTSGTSQSMATLSSQLATQIETGQDLLDDLNSSTAVSSLSNLDSRLTDVESDTSSLDSRLSAIENIDYTGIYSSGSS